MFSINDYGDTVLDVVDCFGNLVQKMVFDSDEELQAKRSLVPITAMDGFNTINSKAFYWVTK